jgi:hypothetical protein
VKTAMPNADQELSMDLETTDDFVEMLINKYGASWNEIDSLNLDFTEFSVYSKFHRLYVLPENFQELQNSPGINHMTTMDGESNPNDFYRVNVGGRFFYLGFEEIAYFTAEFPLSLFAKAFNPPFIKGNIDKYGNVKINRNSKWFSAILLFVRSGGDIIPKLGVTCEKIHVSPGDSNDCKDCDADRQSLNELLEEMNFWGLQDRYRQPISTVDVGSVLEIQTVGSNVKPDVIDID